MKTRKLCKAHDCFINPNVDPSDEQCVISAKQIDNMPCIITEVLEDDSPKA